MRVVAMGYSYGSWVLGNGGVLGAAASTSIEITSWSKGTSRNLLASSAMSHPSSPSSWCVDNAATLARVKCAEGIWTEDNGEFEKTGSNTYKDQKFRLSDGLTFWHHHTVLAGHVKCIGWENEVMSLGRNQTIKPSTSERSLPAHHWDVKFRSTNISHGHDMTRCIWTCPTSHMYIHVPWYHILSSKVRIHITINIFIYHTASACTASQVWISNDASSMFHFFVWFAQGKLLSFNHLTYKTLLASQQQHYSNGDLGKPT